MGQLMLINPRKRKAKRRTVSAAPKRRRRARPALAANPIVRRRRSSIKRVAKRSRRIRRNPIGINSIIGTLTDAGIGAAGAIGIDILYDKLPLPVSMKTGMGGIAAKAGIAIAVGVFGKKILGNTAGKLAAGALTVQAFDLIKSFMPPTLPAAVAGMGYMSPGINGGYLPQSQMGEYVNGLTDNYAFASNGSAMGEYVSGAY